MISIWDQEIGDDVVYYKKQVLLFKVLIKLVYEQQHKIIWLSYNLIYYVKKVRFLIILNNSTNLNVKLLYSIKSSDYA